MSTAEVTAAPGVPAGALQGTSRAAVPAAHTAERVRAAEALADRIFHEDRREKFIPVTRQALMERLTRAHAWPAGQAEQARRFFRYLDYWRQQTYSARLLELEQTYEPFSPDSDLLVTRRFRADERAAMQRRLISQIETLLVQGNFTRIDTDAIELIMTPESHYGLDLHVDMHAFEELAIFYRGASARKATRRNARKLYLKKEEFEVPIFQRLCIVFKLKSELKRIAEIRAEKGCDEAQAEKIYQRQRALLPEQIKSDYVYLKLFKNIPRSDLEMIFPNTRVRFRMLDKVKLGVTAGGGLGMGAVASIGKIAAVAANPVGAAGAVIGLGGVAFRQAMNFVNQRNRYMVTMAQNLYFHAMGDNRGVMTLLADRAAEEDVKEEVLLYSVLAKERVTRAELKDVDAAIEQYLLNTFGVRVNFDVEDALERLMADGLVSEEPGGLLRALPPSAAAHHIDVLWDRYLDVLPDQTAGEGEEFDDDPRATGA